MKFSCTLTYVDVSDNGFHGFIPLTQSAEWLSGASYNVLLNDASQKMAWLTVNTSDMVYHRAWLEDMASTRFQEIGAQAIDGTVYYAMERVHMPYLVAKHAAS